MIYLLRVIIVGAYFFLAAIIGALGCCLRPFNPDNSRLVGRLFSVGAVPLLGIKIRYENLERLENIQPGVVVANHQSNLDLFVLGSSIPKNTVSIGKKSLKYLPFFGQVYWLAGNIMIDRTNRKQSITMMDQVSKSIQEKGTTIWVFPEGTRSGGKGLASFKKGAFHMAMQAQVPIYPIVASTYSGGRLKLNRWHSGDVIIRVLEPIDTTQVAEDKVDDLIASTHARMAQEIAEMDAQLRNKN